ncbi:MAG TPA: hypothetical protein VFP68_07095 [Burkholderiaceae bacterium]|nr:hypothetical protein [Burkholderiaceae bacterium]
MDWLKHALSAGAETPPIRTAEPRRAAIVVGAAGPLGSEVLEQVLASGTFDPVRVLVSGPIAAGMRGFDALSLEALKTGDSRSSADTAFVVFDRESEANGREAAFVRPEPAQLPSLAASLHRIGVRRLLVILPHAPALLPAALKSGLASLDEHAVAATGFEHVVLVRSAQPQRKGAAGSWLARLARSVLAQMHWMVPQQEQPVRARKVAAFVTGLARRLPLIPGGTRVVPPEAVWQAAQAQNLDEWIEAWLSNRQTPQVRVVPGRL